MAPLPAEHKRLIGQWIERALAGYWTHGGYMNWDSGLGFSRWHQAKKLGLTQQALIGDRVGAVAAAGRQVGRAGRSTCSTAGCEFYDRTAVRDGGLADPLFFNVHAVPQEASSARLAAARMQANAARAVEAGLGRKRATRPPALYAYDPDIGRLAVTTPAYNTAIVAVNQRAFPYGGIDLARLFDGKQEIAGTIGGTPPASFGAIVRDVSGRRVLASQVGRSSVSRSVTPLRLIKAPLGVTARASSSAGRAYAGAFTDLRATGTVSGRTASIRVTHRFTPGSIQTRWDVARRATNAAYSVDVLFPSTGRSQAKVTAVLKDGSRVTVGDTRIPLARVRAARGRQPLRRLHRDAADAPGGGRRARHAPRAAVLGARSGPDARRPARALRPLLAHRVHGPDHAGALAVGDQPHLTVLAPEPFEDARRHPGEVGIAASPRVEDVDVVQPAVAEGPQHVVDAAGPAVGLDALADRLGVGRPVAALAVSALAQDVQARADARAVVVLPRPLVDLLRLVVEPEAVVELAVELGGEAADAEADAGALGALVVEVPPGVGVGVALRLQADAVAAADFLVSLPSRAIQWWPWASLTGSSNSSYQLTPITTGVGLDGAVLRVSG